MAPNKPSRTPRSGKSGQQNFKTMKQRLQLKVKEDKPEVQQDHDVLEEDPLASIPREIEQEDGTADEDGDEDHPADEDGDEDPPAGDGDEEDPRKSKKKNQSKFFNRASPMKIVKVCKAMNEDRRKLIISADFGDMLKMKCSKLIPELCRFLMECFNPKTCELEFHGRGRIPVNAQSVFKVLGVPMGSFPVPYHLDVDATSLILNMFGIHGGGQPEITLVAKELGPTYPADQIYLRKFIIYLQSSVFAPTTGTKVSPKCYPSVINTAKIKDLNWAKFIVDMLIETANAKDKKNWFKACMPYLMILYVDSLDTDVIDVPQDVTRSTVWTNQMIKLVADLDTNSDGSFGTLPLKACFRNNSSLFSSDPTTVDMFIRNHVPGITNEEVLAKYRLSIIDMCTVFEDGLSKLLVSLSEQETEANIKDERREDVEQKNEIPKQRRVRRRPHQGVQQKNAEEKTTLPKPHQPIIGMTTDEAREATAHATKSQKRKPMNQEIVQGRGKKKMITEPEGVATHIATSHDTGIQRMCEEKAEPNRQAPATTLENDITVDGSTELHDHDGSGIQISTQDAVEQCRAETEKCHNPVSTCSLPSMADPLKLLQCYGSGSQLSIETTEKGAPTTHVSPTANQGLNVSDEQVQCGSTCGTRLTRKSSGKSKKSVRFVDLSNVPSVQVALQNECTESPLWKGKEQAKDVAIKSSPTPRRSPRFVNAGTNTSNLAFAPADPMIVGDQGDDAAPLITTYPEENCNTNRKLDMVFGSPGSHSESMAERNRQELVEDCPKFDLGFDDPKVSLHAEKAHGTEVKDETIMLEELVIVSSNDDSGDSLDKIYASIDIPTATTVNEEAPVAEEIKVTSEGSKSYTPVPEAHKKRLVRPSKSQKSPYMDVDKKAVSNKFTNEIYDRVCEYGGDSEDKINKVKIIDYDNFFIYLGDLADSVRPRAWLSNSTCEVALHVLSVEKAEQRKHVMPLRLATKLRSATCVHDRLVKKLFKFTPQSRLDHNDQIMFPVLQDLTPDQKKFTGHYYLIVLNLKAERFEVMDSLRGKKARD